MEALGVCVDNDGISSKRRTHIINTFYTALLSNIDPRFNARIGSLIKNNLLSKEASSMDLEQRVEKLISVVPCLSETLKRFYIGVLIEFLKEGRLDESTIEKKLSYGYHIHEILLPTTVNTQESYKPTETSISLRTEGKIQLPNKEEVIETNSTLFAMWIERNLNEKSFAEMFKRSSPITSSMVLDISDTSPRILFCNGNPYVAINLKNDRTYLDNYYKIEELIGLSDINSYVSVVPEIAVVKSQGNFYFISRYMGNDFENEILDRNNGHLARRLEAVAKDIEAVMVSNGIFFRNLSPRNLIKGVDGKTYIIDFDNVITINSENKIKIFMRSLNRLAWFADIFEVNIIKGIFHSFDLKDKNKIMIPVGSFERKFLGGNVEEITLVEYERIFQHTLDFEKRDTYKGVAVLGHQLGRFISDYWSEDKEVELIQLISSNPERIHEIRAILYFASQIDQELCLRKIYGLNNNETLLSLRVFEKLKNTMIALSSFFILSKDLNFEEKYEQFVRECGL